ncbi:MAG: tetratricopeptide repeat protein, partial [Sulfurovum sp.]
MENIDEELYQYVWDNIFDLEAIFATKAYERLLKYNIENNKKSFDETLDLLLDMDKTLKEKIKSQYENIDEMSIEDIVKNLQITSYDNFVDKKKYIENAEYFVENYKEEDDIYVVLLNNLAFIYEDMGEYEKSEPLYLKSLKITAERLGENHLSTAFFYNNLAGLYESMGKYEKSEPLYLKALKIREESLGKNHSKTAISYHNLASLYKSMREYKKAEPLYLKAQKIIEESSGKNHPDTAISYNNLASLYYSMEEYEKAEPFSMKALK